MLLTPHVFVGMAIARAVPNPIVAFILSVVLHFFGDAVPHWDFYSHTSKEERIKGWRPIAVMADFGLGIGVGLAFTFFALWVKHDSTLAIRTFICGIASVLPDALEAPHIYLTRKIKFVESLTGIQSRLQTQLRLPWGLLTQFLVVGLCLLLTL